MVAKYGEYMLKSQEKTIFNFSVIPWKAPEL
jgi:hypothetical protein